MDTTTTTTTTEDTNVITMDKPKRKRAPRVKIEAVPKDMPVLAPPPDRELDDLVGVDLEDMTNTELQLVALDLMNKCNELGSILVRKDQEIRTLTQQVSRHQSFAGYVRQTMDHARDSLLLQADALNVMSRGTPPQKG